MTRRSFLECLAGTALLPTAACVSEPSGRGVRGRALRAAEEARQQFAYRLWGGCAFCSTGDPEVMTFGTRLHAPTAEEPLKPDALFDMMSVTKTFVALVCAQLVEEGLLDPDAPFTKYIPEHVLGKSCGITVRDLATHSGGFDDSRPYMKQKDYLAGLWSKRPVWKRRERFCYACSNLIYLGHIAERLTGKRLDDLCRERVFGPLGMKDTRWWPLPEELRPRAVQIMYDRKLIGLTQDGTCRRYGKPQGNAGVFSTASDMLRYVTDLLHRATFKPAVYDLLFTPTFEHKTGRRSFGWDMTPDKMPQGWSDATILHSGFSGQTVAIDPRDDFAGVVLTSRTAGHETGCICRRRILTLLKGADLLS